MLRAAWIVFENEFRLLARDRAALFMLFFAPIVIIAVAEYDRLRRAALLAGGDDFPVTDEAILAIGVDLRLADPLQAISAFFHDPTTTNGDLGVP